MCSLHIIQYRQLNFPRAHVKEQSKIMPFNQAVLLSMQKRLQNPLWCSELFALKTGIPYERMRSGRAQLCISNHPSITYICHKFLTPSKMLIFSVSCTPSHLAWKAPCLFLTFSLCLPFPPLSCNNSMYLRSLPSPFSTAFPFQSALHWAEEAVLS